MTWQFSLTGLLIGVLVGLTGMGGGSLMTPILILLFGFNAKVAVGTDILHGAVFKSFGAARCRQLGTVHARLAGWMFLGSGPMSLAGVAVASSLGKGAQATESYAVGAALVLGGIGLVVKAILIASKFTVAIPERMLRLGLAGVLGLSGVKLLNVPQASWVLGIGLGVLFAAFAAWAITARLARPRPVTALD